MKLEFVHFNSLIYLVNHFDSEHRCCDFISEHRWYGEVVCPFCGCRHVYTCGNGDNQFKFSQNRPYGLMDIGPVAAETVKCSRNHNFTQKLLEVCGIEEYQKDEYLCNRVFACSLLDAKLFNFRWQYTTSVRILRLNCIV